MISLFYLDIPQGILPIADAMVVIGYFFSLCALMIPYSCFVNVSDEHNLKKALSLNFPFFPNFAMILGFMPGHN